MNFSTVTASNGSFQAMPVTQGTSYSMSLSYPVYAGTSTTASGTISYSPPLNNPVAISGDTTYSFTMPGIGSAPTLVTLSGKVTDPGGNAVSGVTVSATSSLLTGATATGTSYTNAASTVAGTATTDTSGNYSIKVVPGTDYTLTFTK